MKDTKETQQKIAARYNNTFEWAMTADRDVLMETLDGKRKFINIFKDNELVFSTGVSRTDKHAIVEALKIRK